MNSPYTMELDIPSEFKNPALDESVKRLTETVWKMVADAYSRGYADAHRDAETRYTNDLF